MNNTEIQIKTVEELERLGFNVDCWFGNKWFLEKAGNYIAVNIKGIIKKPTKRELEDLGVRR